jgi:predicted secreted protein
MSPSTWLGRRRNALLEAAGLLEDLGIDQTQPVDVFGIVDRLDLWLTFLPLDNTLGACLPVGHGGIMITTQRQPAVQRYTAAHEIGHWILDHGHAWFDDEEAILRPSAPERERLAQLFAAYLLMPPPLVHAAAGHHGIEAGSPIEPEQAYLVARDIGISYEAAVRQMAELDFVSDRDRDRLLHVSPIAAKRALAHGTRPLVGSADVWPIDEHWDGTHLDVTTLDEIVIALPENRTTGYRWMTRADLQARDGHRPQPAPPSFTNDTPARGNDANVAKAGRTSAASRVDLAASDTDEAQPLVTVADQYVAGGPPRDRRQAQAARRELVRGQAGGPRRVGATGRRWLSIQARAEGTWRYELAYAAAHQQFAAPVAAFSVEATVRPTPAVAHARSLLAAVPGDYPDAPSPTAS